MSIKQKVPKTLASNRMSRKLSPQRPSNNSFFRFFKLGFYRNGTDDDDQSKLVMSPPDPAKIESSRSRNDTKLKLTKSYFKNLQNKETTSKVVGAQAAAAAQQANLFAEQTLTTTTADPTTQDDTKADSEDGEKVDTPPALQQKGYSLDTLIGKGGFAKVYKLIQRSSNKVFACKVFDLASLNVAWVEKCLQQEIAIMMAIHHPNLLQAFDYIILKSHAFIMMPLVNNGTVSSEMLRLGRPFKEQQAKIWLYQIVDGVNYLHLHRIAHRDLKLENYLLDDNRHVFIGKLSALMMEKVVNISTQFSSADYSFSILEPNQPQNLEQAIKMRDKPIEDDIPCGTTEYMSPELLFIVLKNYKESKQEEAKPKSVKPFKVVRYDAKSADVYAMGVSLFEMLNFFNPFDPKFDIFRNFDPTKPPNSPKSKVQNEERTFRRVGFVETFVIWIFFSTFSKPCGHANWKSQDNILPSVALWVQVQSSHQVELRVHFLDSLAALPRPLDATQVVDAVEMQLVRRCSATSGGQEQTERDDR